jgi:hypothetical protein
MAEKTAQFDFFAEYVLGLLESFGLGGMTEEQLNTYLPQLVAQLEQRVGLALLPKLSDTDGDTFARMVNTPGLAGKDWQEFWYKSVPNFEEELHKILLDFKEEMKTFLV